MRTISAIQPVRKVPYAGYDLARDRGVAGIMKRPAHPEGEERALREEVEAFLSGEIKLTDTQIMVLRGIMRRFIEARAITVSMLERTLDDLVTREDFGAWFRNARMHDFDPVE